MREWLSPGRKEQSPLALRGLAAFGIAAALLTAAVGSGSAKAATGQRTLTIYSVPTLAQFLNHQDDRERAVTNNPFKVDSGKLAPNETGNGPFAGDSTLYGFKLYTSANLTKRAGTAVYTCYYNFFKHALCSASFDLSGGTLLATGAVNFKNTHFRLAITGGSGVKYGGANGEVKMVQVTKNKQRLDFVLVD
jgi:hypothetical protein